MTRSLRPEILPDPAEMALEPAGEKDFDTCWHMIEEGRRFQQDQGFVQWTEDYPCQKHQR